MAMSEVRQRIMPTNDDRERGERLQYKEAILLTNPTNPEFKGEVIKLLILIKIKFIQYFEVPIPNSTLMYQNSNMYVHASIIGRW